MNTNNPVVAGSVGVSGAIILVKAIITLGTSSGWWDEEQAAAWIVFFNDVLPIVFVWAGAWWVSRKTTSLADPKDKDGVELTRQGTNEPAIEKLEALHSEAIMINKLQDRGLN